MQPYICFAAYIGDDAAEGTIITTGNGQDSYGSYLTYGFVTSGTTYTNTTVSLQKIQLTQVNFFAGSRTGTLIPFAAIYTGTQTTASIQTGANFSVVQIGDLLSSTGGAGAQSRSFLVNGTTPPPINLAPGQVLTVGYMASSGGVVQYSTTGSGTIDYIPLANTLPSASSLPASLTANANTSLDRTLKYNVGFNVINAPGAVVPFTTYEGEAGIPGGGATVVALTGSPTNNLSTPLLEASGRAYMQLAGTGQSVTWTNGTGQNVTAMAARICIPDSTDGTGINATLDLYINGVFRQAMAVTSTQSWDYGNGAGLQTPSSGGAYNFYDEYHFFITGAPVAPGSTITLQQDSTNTAAFYYIDCIDLENPPPPLAQPANSLSVISYGAIANNPAVDSSTAIQNCITAAATAGESVWIPSGIFYLNTGNALSETNTTISGAGMWYTTIYHNIPSNQTANDVFRGNGGTIENLTIDSNAASRHINDGGGFNMYGSDWTVNATWAVHTGFGVWGTGTNGLVENSRYTHTWADGINLNASPLGPTDHLTAQNNYIRGPGDDGLAVNSQGPAPSTQQENTSFLSNTSILSLAHCLAAYGGDNDDLENNYLADPIKAPALVVSDFGTYGYQVTNSLVTGNTLVRGGGFAGNNSGALVVNRSPSNVVIASNIINNSLFSGIQLNGTLDDVTFENNIINSPALQGITASPLVVGDGAILGNTITGLNVGQPSFQNVATTNYRPIIPIQGSAYLSMSNVSTQACSEGGSNLSNIQNNSYTEYTNINLNGVTAFEARVATIASGNIQVWIDGPSSGAGGTLLGTCPVTSTGDWQTWVDTSCTLSGAKGYHNVYLVYTGGSGYIFNLQWFEFLGSFTVTDTANYSSASGTFTSRASTEGYNYISGSVAGTYTVYNSVTLDGMRELDVRTASLYSGGSIQACLDSPTGMVIGTATVPATGGTQNWSTEVVAIPMTSGTHNIYLLYTPPPGGNSFNFEWFTFAGGYNPTEAASYNAVSGNQISTQTCSEGGLNLDYIQNGNYAIYNQVNLTGLTSFTARVASNVAVGNTAGTIGIHLDSPAGVLIGTMTVPGTGGWQTWSTQTNTLSSAVTGYHNIYLVFSGGGSNLFNLEWFSFGY